MPNGWTLVQETPKSAWTPVVGASAPTRVAGLPAGESLPAMPGITPVSMPEGIASTVGSHLKNLVMGPYQAFTDAPRNANEQRIKGTQPDSSMASNVLGQFGLGAERMLVQPTIDALHDSAELRKQGGPRSSLTAASTYDSGGDNIPTAGSKLVDAIPIVGPWSRAFSNEYEKNGILPAAAGLATDVLAPDAVGGVLGKIRDAAPSMAEGAMSIRRGDRGYGKTPGRAILDETSGVRPETVGKQAQAKLDTLNPSIDAMAAAHPGTISLAPARQVVSDSIGKSMGRNSKITADAVVPVGDQLATNYQNGLPLAVDQTAIGALNLKRGLRDSFVKNWSPDAASMASRDTAKLASRSIDSELDSALGPEFSDTNQRISSLIPVADAAEKLSRADELPQRFGDKLKAHTGALTSAVMGAMEGAHAGGPLGAIGGGTLGFALPELISTPTARMVMARGMNSPIPKAVFPPLAAGGIVTHPKKEKK